MNSYTLTQDGQPRATIVIAKRPTHAAMFGAKELQYHIYKISGAVLPIVTDDCANVLSAQRPTRILVGSSAVTTQPEFASDTFKQQEYTVACSDGNTIVLMGRDAELQADRDLPLSERIKSITPYFGNACRFDHSRPITVTNFSLNPERGSIEAWVWLEPKKSIPAEKHNTYETLLELHADYPPKIMISRDYIGDGASKTPVGDDQTRILYWAISKDVVTGALTHPMVHSQPFCAEGEYGNWHHILATYDAVQGQIELFVDGHSHGIHPRCPVISGTNTVMHIGGVVEKTVSGQLKGAIDEVRLSRDVRKPEFSGPFAPDQKTILLLHFDEENGVVSPMWESASNQNVLFEPVLPLPGLWDERGTLNAVYDFLERSCGVRWYAPGKIGEVCPSKPTLDVDVKTVPRRKPAMVHRSIHTPVSWFMVGPPAKPEVPIPDADRDTWMLRMGMGGTPRTVGHSLPGRCANYLDRHPGWFAHDGSTILTLVDENGKTVLSKLCYRYDLLGKPLDDPSSNVLDERVIVALCKDARNHFEGKEAILGSNHMKDCYSLVPADRRGWCECPECRKRIFHSDKVSDDLFSHDERSYSVHSFTRRIAREIQRKYPEWIGEKWLCQCAYAKYAHYPRWKEGSLPEGDLADIDPGNEEAGIPSEIEEFDEEIKGKKVTWCRFKDIEPSVFTWLCLHARTLWNEKVQENDRVILSDWRNHEQTGKRLGVYLYYNKPISDIAFRTEPFNSFPAFCPSKIMSLFAETKDADAADQHFVGFKGMAGVHIEMSAAFASFLHDQLELYLTFKLAYDPEMADDRKLSVATPIDDFFKDYYGPAAGAMKSVYRDIEHVFTTTPLPVDFTEEMTWGKVGLGQPERMAGYLKLMADAVVATRRTARGFGAARTQTYLAREVATARPMEEPTVYAERVDLFRRGVWNYMLEGYCTYWNKQLDTPRLPLLKLHLGLLDSKQSNGLENVLKGLPWGHAFWPFGYGHKQEFGEPSLELLPPPSSWLCAEEYGGVLIVTDRDHAFLRDVAQQIGAQVAPASGPVEIVELRDTNLAGRDWQLRLFYQLAKLGHVNPETHQAPAILIVGWTTGFPEETS